MIKVSGTTVFVSKGYEGAPALRFSENGESVRFRVGHKEYDKREEDNYRWMNISVKAFGKTCEKIQKMNIKEGSCLNIWGRLDEDKWTDKATNQPRSMYVIILEDVEYAYTGKKAEASQGQAVAVQQPVQYQQAPMAPVPQGMPVGQAVQQPAQAPQGMPAPAQQMMPGAAAYPGFTGYEPFGGQNLFSELVPAQ